MQLHQKLLSNANNVQQLQKMANKTNYEEIKEAYISFNYLQELALYRKLIIDEDDFAVVNSSGKT